MIKRLTGLICTLLLLLAASAAAERTVTIEDIMNANRVSTLLERHSSIALLQRMSTGESAIWANRLYRYSAHRKDSTVREGDTEYLRTKDHCLMLYYMDLSEDDSGAFYPIPFIMLDAGVTDNVYYDVEAGKGTDLLYDTDITAREQVKKAEEADGALTVTTWLTGQDFVDGWGGSYQAGAYCELVYTLDAETLELQADVETVVDAKGSPLSESLYYRIFGKDENLQSIQQMLYDLPVPEEAETMLTDLNRYLEAAGDDARTVTYILDPGTERERKLTSTGAKGYGVVLAAGNWNYKLFLDAGMTEPAPADDYRSDRVLYVQMIAPDEKGNEA